MSPHAATLNKPREARVLIIEDEPMLAYALEEILIEAGFKTAGVAGRLETALALIAIGDCDVAIVDANLAGVSAGPAASALAARGIPYIVVSGYSPEQQQGAFSGALFIQKPCRPNELIRALRSVLPANEFWPADAS
jgi:DNA-binding NarL/FixJ family response regulator